MKSSRRVLIAILLLTLFAFLLSQLFLGSKNTSKPAPSASVSQSEPPLPESLKRLEFADPERDFQQALGSGEIAFLGVAGYSVDVPGVSNYLSEFKSRIAVKVIEGTSDEIEGPEHARFQGIARDYALRYNRLVLDSVGRQRSPDPR